MNNIDKNYLNRKAVFYLEELATYTGISKSTLSKYTAEKSIPYYKRGKFNFFDRKEIIKWMKEFPIPQQNVPSDFEQKPGTITVEENTK